MPNLSYPTERTATDGHDEYNITKVRMTTIVLIMVIIVMACDIEDEDDITLQNVKIGDELLVIIYVDFEQHRLGLNYHLQITLCDVDYTWWN